MMKRLVNAFFLVVPAVTYSLDWGASVSTGLNYTSNAFLEESTTTSELQRDAEFALDVDHQTKRASVEGDYRFNRTYYPESFGDDTTLQGNADVTVSILPRNLVWNASHIRVDSVRDFDENDTPTNRAIRQNFQTGPTFYFRLTPVDELSSSVSRSWRTIEFEPERDSETDLMSLSYSHQFSRLLAGTLSFNQSEVSFEEAEGYEHVSQSLSLRRIIKDGGLSLIIGNNEIQQANFKSSSPLLNASFYLNRYNADLDVSYSRKLTHSSSEVLLDDTVISGLPFFGVIQITDIVENESLRANISKSVADAITVGVGFFLDSTVSQRTKISSDRRGWVARVDYQRPLSATTAAGLRYDTRYVDRSISGEADTSLHHNLVARYDSSITDSLSIDSSVGFSTRVGSVDNDFDNIFASIRIVYQVR